jgi:flagellin
VYINFDGASATLLLSLSSLNTQLNQTETQISTTRAVNSAADNPVVWAQATRAQSRAAGWGAVANAIQGAETPELTAATGSLSSVLTTLTAMQTAIEGVQSGSSDPTTALSTLQQDGQTLTDTVANAASSNGVNLLNGSTTSVNFTVGYAATGATSTVSYTTQALTGTSGLLQTAQAAASATATDFTSLTANDLSNANISTTLANIATAITNVTNYSTSLGAESSMETNMQTYAQTMQANFQDDATSLVAADTTAASARATALETQLQLATEALSIANQSSALVLKLFS